MSLMAAGTDAVLLSPGTVDPFSPKVLRSAMGSHFNLPILTRRWNEIKNLQDEHKLDIFIADSTNGHSLYDTNLKRPLGLIIGGEAEGVSDWANILDAEKIHIPIQSNVDSLNSAVAASIRSAA